MKKILLKILACSFALVIPLTAFLITTNQKKVSASESFDRWEFDDDFDDSYFRVLDTDAVLRGTGSNVQFNFGNYQYTPKLNIPYLSNNFVLHGNSFVYDYTLDSTTYYTLTRSKFLDYMVMFAPTPTNHITFDFNNLVIFYYDDDKTLTQSEFVSALSYYFSFISFVLDYNINCDIYLSGLTADISGNFGDRVNGNLSFDTYLFSEKFLDVRFSTFRDCLVEFFNGMYSYYGEISPDYSSSRLNGDLVNFTDSDVINYFNSYFILPNFSITFNFDTDVLFYLRSNLYDYTKDNLYYEGDYTNLYAYNLYRPDFLYTILGYYGFDNYSLGFGTGYDYGYNNGYIDGSTDLTPFDAIIGIVEDFLNFKVFPNFPIYYFFLIAFGFALFGLLVKYALGG